METELRPLFEGPTWREIIAKALKDTGLATRDWSDQARFQLADEILRAMRRAGDG